MIAALLFTMVAAAVVWLAGRKDAALDPRLTGLALLVTAAFPLLLVCMPKVVHAEALTDMAASVSLPDAGWMKTLEAIWLAGFLWSLGKLFAAQIQLVQWRKRSVDGGRIGTVEIRPLACLAGPVAAGIFRKVVFVPKDWLNWPERFRNAALIHELAHHERRDPFWRWVGALAGAIYWFNPLVFWMNRRLSVQCEFHCDARALGSGIDAREYANFLCEFAGSGSSPSLGVPMFGRSGLESRVRRLMGNPSDSVSSGFLFLFAALVVGTALMLAMFGIDTSQETLESDAVLRLSADPFPGN